MSASVLDEERQACIDAGMDRHLSKPFRRAELAALLDDIAGAHACSAASTVAGVDDFDRATWAELRDLFGSDGVLCLRSEEHTSELQSLMRISYAVFCLKKKNTHHKNNQIDTTTIYNTRN